MSSEKQRTAWEKQMLVREKNRPTIHDYLPRIFEEFFELHGDRGYGDDGAILGGIARLNGVPVTIIAEVKGRNLEENKRSNFAMPHPEGYRKALRLAKQAAAAGGTACAVLNGANEAAVGLFLQERIGFLQIADAVDEAMQRIQVKPLDSLETAERADRLARQAVCDKFSK